MKDGKLESTDLDATDHVRVLLLILLEKGIVTHDEFTAAQKAILELKNEQLEKELKDNPGAKFMFDLMFGSKKSEGEKE